MSTVSREILFVPDQTVAVNNPGFFEKWNRESEGNYIRQIFSVVPDDSLHKLELEVVSESSFPDSAVFVLNYTLKLHHTLTEPGYPREAEGQAEFWMTLNQQTGYWYVYRWVDTGAGDKPSWSSFKVVFGK